jgi:hypothetical protein
VGVGQVGTEADGLAEVGGGGRAWGFGPRRPPNRRARHGTGRAGRWRYPAAGRPGNWVPFRATYLLPVRPIATQGDSRRPKATEPAGGGWHGPKGAGVVRIKEPSHPEVQAPSQPPWFKLPLRG